MSTLERSGVLWCERFPPSRSTADLDPTWRPKAEAFIQALRNAGALVTVAATRRPAERAWLMHYAWKIDRGLVAPKDVPAREGIVIDWTHGGDNRAARAAAGAMCRRYALRHQPSLTSRHIEGKAVDMSISRLGPIDVVDGLGKKVRVTTDEELYALGRTYGVIKLVSDPPHWSSDGR